MASGKTVHVKFKQACSFFGKDYGLGSHSVPEAVVEHVYFKLLAGEGKAEIVTEAKASPVLDYSDIPAAPVPQPKSEVASPAPAESVSTDEAAQDEASEEVEPSEKSSKHDKKHGHKNKK